MKNEFSSFVYQQLNDRGWSQNELSRRSGMSSTAISEVLTGKRSPGKNFCIAISRAFRIPREIVFEKAGILLPSSDNPVITEIISLVKELDESNLNRVVDHARFVYHQQMSTQEQMEKELELVT